ncbi:glutamate--tRNA ligase [Alicyclobacillus ferrooxydans]|uniref:Glutamate--tRNA ligase n=1 Tax=Alicyclobacillus ferrooxydans TaxID=471514 RepID=A0A0P9GSV4_9BACL|nr:glutamate--tRNA ligase [Alicyclobacillus ferrooxydans]KPV44172.1 glutamyl-tRNA synthetase [Alicyclobacillus ferrooxydans]
MSVRVRYAPSPTGHLHIGGVRTALFNYLFAKHHDGAFILRIEDTDLERNVVGAEDEMLDGFRWLGFEWAEGPDTGGQYGPYRCTERLPIYQEHLARLAKVGAVYPCYCTPEELQADKELAAQDGRVARYSGRCRHLTTEQRRALEQEGRKPSWRFAIPPGETILFEDLVRGEVSFETDELSDFVVMKSNDIPTYQFQVVVDDALMKITHVIRGEEHLSNTPWQILVYRALGYEEPRFAHLPQVLNSDRKKLSKRDPNVQPVHVYREKGYLPEAIVNFLALLGWSPGGEEELLSLDDLVQRFDLDRVSRSGAVFDTQKLQWMASTYIKKLPVEVLTDLVRVQLERFGWELPPHGTGEWLVNVVGLYQEKMACAEDFVGLAKTFFESEMQLDEEALQVLADPVARQVVKRYLELAESDTEWTPEASRLRFKQIQSELGVKGRQLFMPVRAAVSGTVHGPDLQLTITCLSKPWVLERAKKALSHVDKQGSDASQ